MSHDSNRAIYWAMGANLGIAVMKAIGAGITGSAAMFSEAVHSVVDTGNGAFLLIGRARSKRPADGAHNFGRGGEMNVWVLMVAMFIFVLGAGVSLFECYEKLRHPEALDWNSYDLLAFIHPSLVGLLPQVPAYGINMAILVIAFLLEGKSCLVALKELASEIANKGLMRALTEAKDPTVLAVIVEDSGAVVGLSFAFACQALAYGFDMPVFDALGSGIIGILLGVAASFLMIECISLMSGESIVPAAAADIIESLEAEGRITKICQFKSLCLGPTTVLVCISVDFADNMTSRQVEESVAVMRDRIEAILDAHYGKRIDAEVYINVESSRTFGEGFVPEIEEDGSAYVEEDDVPDDEEATAQAAA